LLRERMGNGKMGLFYPSRIEGRMSAALDRRQPAIYTIH
jgi:hypothetical protein